jgi:hypothetical protein
MNGALSRFEQISLRKSTTAISSGPGKCFQVKSKGQRKDAKKSHVGRKG